MNSYIINEKILNHTYNYNFNIKNNDFDDLIISMQQINNPIKKVKKTVERVVEEKVVEVERVVEEKVKECVVCMDKPRAFCVTSCKHFCLCEENTCRFELKKCPICNVAIDQNDENAFMKIFDC